MSPALAGRFLATAPPGKSLITVFYYKTMIYQDVTYSFIHSFIQSINIRRALLRTRHGSRN